MSMLYGQAYCLPDITCVYRRLQGDSLQWQYWRNHIKEAQSQMILLFDHFIELFNDTDICDLLNKERQLRIEGFKKKGAISLFLNPLSWKGGLLSMLFSKLKQTDYKKFHTKLDD